MCVQWIFFSSWYFFPFFLPFLLRLLVHSLREGRKTYNLHDLFPKGPWGRGIKRNSSAIIILKKIIILIFLIAKKNLAIITLKKQIQSKTSLRLGRQE